MGGFLILGRKSAPAANHGSLLKLCDINGSSITTCTCDHSITCLAYTNLPEGISINAIAGGLSNGNVRYVIFVVYEKYTLSNGSDNFTMITYSMWNAWDLAVIRDISLNSSHSPVVRYGNHSL